MVRATVIEVLGEDETSGRGDFDFVQLPEPGDRFTVPSQSGGIDVMRSLYVEHHPIRQQAKNR